MNEKYFFFHRFVRKSYAQLIHTEILRALKSYGNRTRTKDVRKSYWKYKLNEIIYVL